MLKPVIVSPDEVFKALIDRENEVLLIQIKNNGKISADKVSTLSVSAVKTVISSDSSHFFVELVEKKDEPVTPPEEEAPDTPPETQEESQDMPYMPYD